MDGAFSVKKKKVGLRLLRFQETLTGALRRSSDSCQFMLWRALVLGLSVEVDAILYKNQLLLKPN